MFAPGPTRQRYEFWRTKGFVGWWAVKSSGMSVINAPLLLAPCSLRLSHATARSFQAGPLCFSSFYHSILPLQWGSAILVDWRFGWITQVRACRPLGRTKHPAQGWIEAHSIARHLRGFWSPCSAIGGCSRKTTYGDCLAGEEEGRWCRRRMWGNSGWSFETAPKYLTWVCRNKSLLIGGLAQGFNMQSTDLDERAERRKGSMIDSDIGNQVHYHLWYPTLLVRYHHHHRNLWFYKDPPNHRVLIVYFNS